MGSTILGFMEFFYYQININHEKKSFTSIKISSMDQKTKLKEKTKNTQLNRDDTHLFTRV